MQDRKIVTLCLLATFLIIVANKAFVKHAFPKPKVFMGLSVAFLFVGFLTEIAPKLASTFAILILVAVGLDKGPAAFNGISGALSAHPASHKGGKKNVR